MIKDDLNKMGYQLTDTAVILGIDGTKIHPAVKFSDGSIIKTCSCGRSRGGLSKALTIIEVDETPNCKG
jgi:hypothetical protein